MAPAAWTLSSPCRSPTSAGPAACAERRRRICREYLTGDLVIEREISGWHRAPHVERILGRVIGALPIVIDRDVVDVRRVFGVAAPRVAHVVEIVRAEHVAAHAPAGDVAFVR